MNELRFAFRQLRSAPAFTVTALATIAICLGANLAIFAVLDAILLRPLPFPHSAIPVPAIEPVLLQPCSASPATSKGSVSP